MSPPNFESSLSGEFEWDDAGSGLIDIRAMIEAENRSLAAEAETNSPSDYPPDPAAELSMPPGDPDARELSKQLRRAIRTNRRRMAGALKDRRWIRASTYTSLTVAVLSSVMLGAEIAYGPVPATLKAPVAAIGVIAPLVAFFLFAQERFRHADTRCKRLKRTIDEFESMRSQLLDGSRERVAVVRGRAGQVLRVLQPEHEHW